MSIKKVFVVTPFGKNDSNVRSHADKMKECVLDPLGRKLGCSFETTLAERGPGVVAERIFRKTQEADLVIADMAFGNLNVFYEIGLAHALNKPVILISPEGTEIPFDVTHLSRIEYKTSFDSMDGGKYAVEELSHELGKVLDELNAADEDKMQRYLPYSKLLTTYVPEVITEYKGVISDLRDIINGLSRANVITEYIKGEDNAFMALTTAVNAAEKSIFTTRFSPFTVKDRRKSANDFFQTMKKIMNGEQENCPKEFERIIATNDEKKLTEVLELVESNKKKSFTIYLHKRTYNFEIVIIDEVIVFIHFNNNKTKTEQESGEIISATLKVTSPWVAKEFKEIFTNIRDSKDDTLMEIKCVEINNENYAEKEAEIKEKFNEGLAYYKK